MFNKIQLTVFTLLVFVCCVVIFPIRKSLKSQWIGNDWTDITRKPHKI